MTPANETPAPSKNTPTPAEIEGVLREATGDPSSGAIAEWLPAMAQAVADWLNPEADAT